MVIKKLDFKQHKQDNYNGTANAKLICPECKEEIWSCSNCDGYFEAEDKVECYGEKHFCEEECAEDHYNNR